MVGGVTKTWTKMHCTAILRQGGVEILHLTGIAIRTTFTIGCHRHAVTVYFMIGTYLAMQLEAFIHRDLTL